MTTFKMPEPEFKDLGYAYTTCVSGDLYSKEQLKKALRDVLEQAAKLAEGAMHFSEPIARDIRAMKEQIK